MDIRYLLKYEDLIEVLIEYYKTEVDTLYSANEKLNFGWWICGIIYIVSGMSLSVNLAFINNINNLKWSTVFFILIAFSALLFFILIAIRNRYMEKLIQEKYNIRIKDRKKVAEVASTLQMHRIVSFLKDNVFSKDDSLSEKEKILVLIISKLEDKAYTKIVPKLFIPGIFATLFVPTWVEYIGIIFKDSSSEYALKLLISYTVLALLFSIIIGAINLMGKDMKSLFEKKEKQIIKSLVRQIKNLHIRLLFKNEV
jgi:hypothetical protein